MNKKQRLCFICGVVLIVLMGLFPPYTYANRVVIQAPLIESFAGYYPIFSPPPPQKFMFAEVRIDTTRLFIQWVLVAALFGSGIVLLRR
jgi:hypothetical protein